VVRLRHLGRGRAAGAVEDNHHIVARLAQLLCSHERQVDRRLPGAF
jgi:hypothetical protein